MGSFSGFVASAVTSPLDIVKTRMQVQTPNSITYYSNVYQGLSEIAKTEGPRALFRGTTARALNQGLATGIMLGCYGVFRAQASKQMGWLPQQDTTPPPRRAAGAGRKQEAARLQSWVTPATYDEDAWPAHGGGAKSPPPAHAVSERGFIPPFAMGGGGSGGGGSGPTTGATAVSRANAGMPQHEGGRSPPPSSGADGNKNANAVADAKKSKPDHGFIRPLGGW